jgi:Helix-turn-helix domain
VKRPPVETSAASPPLAGVTSVPVLCVGIKHAAELLGGLSPAAVRALITNGDLPVVKLPGVRRGSTSRRILIAVRDLEEFVARYRTLTNIAVPQAHERVRRRA